MAGGLIEIAGVALAQQRNERAAYLLGAAAARVETSSRAAYERLVAACRAALDEVTFAAAWDAGQALTLEQAVAEALGDRK